MQLAPSGFDSEHLTLTGALVIAIVALWRAYLAKAKQVETLIEAVTRTLALAERALERCDEALEKVTPETESRKS